MLISQTQFNRLASVMNIAPVEQLGESEAVLVQTPETKRDYPPQGNTMDIRIAESVHPLHIVSRTDPAAFLSYTGKLLVVQDGVFERLEQEHRAGEVTCKITPSLWFPIPASFQARRTRKRNWALS